MDNAVWREVVEEARDRLSQGTAKDVDDVVRQFIGERLVRHPRDSERLKATLLEHR